MVAHGPRVRHSQKIATLDFQELTRWLGLVNFSVLRSTTLLIQERNYRMEELLDREEYGQAWGIAFAFAVGLTMIPAIICLWYPQAIGPGMPEVISFLNGTQVKNAYTWKVLVVKIIGMVGVVGGGLFTGYDGPMAQVGALIGLTLLKLAKRWRPLARRLYNKQEEKGSEKESTMTTFYRIHHHRESRLVGAVGSATAVASSFRAPLSGVAFALEEAISFFESSLILNCFVCCTVTYTVGLFIYSSGFISGVAYGLFSTTVFCSIDIPVVEFLNYIIIGCSGGVLGALYNIVLSKVRSFRDVELLRKYPLLRLVYLLFVICITVTVIVHVPRGYNCRNYADAFAYLEKFDCRVSCSFDEFGSSSSKIVGSKDCTDPCLVPNGVSILEALAVRQGNTICPSIREENLPFIANKTFIDPTPISRAVFELSGDFKILSKNLEKDCYYEMRSLILQPPE